MLVQGQDDTLQLKEFNVEARITVTEPYKRLVFDSLLRINAPTNLAEVLTNQSTVYVKSYGQSGLATLSIRGTGASHTQIYWNGVVVNSPTLGQIDVAQLPAWLIDEAELHYGSGSLVDGSGGLGGGLQLNSLPQWGRAQVELQQVIGSYGEMQSGLKARYGTSKWQGVSKLLWQQQENDYPYRDFTQQETPTVNLANANYKQWGAVQEVYGKIGMHDQVSARLWYFNSDRAIPTIMTIAPGTATQTDVSFKSMLEWSRAKGRWRHQFKTALLSDELTYTDPDAALQSEVDTRSSKSQYRLKHYGKSTTYTAAAFYDHDQALSSGFDEVKVQDRAALFVNYEQNIGQQLLLTLMARQEMIDGKASPFAPSLGMRYWLEKSERFGVKINISKNYRAPTLNDLYWNLGGNPELRPEEGWSAEGGVIYGDGTPYSLEVTGFYSTVTNWIQWLPNADGVWAPQNLLEVENKGIEVVNELGFYLGSMKVALNAAYTYVNAINKASAHAPSIEGKQLIYVPQHKLSGNAVVAWKKYFARYNHQYTGKAYLTTDNIAYMPYFAPANLQIGRRIQQKKHVLTISAEVRNLYDEAYQVIAYRPMPGRHYRVIINYRWEP